MSIIDAANDDWLEWHGSGEPTQTRGPHQYAPSEDWEDKYDKDQAKVGT